MNTPTMSLPSDRRRVKYIRRLDQVPEIPPDEAARLQPVTEEYVFRANDYYLRLIDWNDPDDPIRQLIIPRREELNDWGRLDASNESAVTVARGVQHKYVDTVLLLCNEVCGAYCRYCFRKRLFMDDNDEVTNDVSAGLAYIAEHPEVSNVLLTGGDPLLMSTRRLVEIFEALRGIEHVRIIRIGSKMPAFDPWRVMRDEDLQAAFRKYSTPEKRIYLMAHFDHPRELTDDAIAGIDACLRSGVICVNQCPLIKGINDDPDVLAEMYSKLSYIGCPRTTCSRAGRPRATSRTRFPSCAAGASSRRRSAGAPDWRGGPSTACRTRPARWRSSASTTSGSTCATTRPRTRTTSAASSCAGATTTPTGWTSSSRSRPSSLARTERRGPESFRTGVGDSARPAPSAHAPVRGRPSGGFLRDTR